MSTATGVLIVLAIVAVGLYNLISKALCQRANVRAGARFGPGSFFIEVTDQKPEKPQLPEE